MAFRVGLPRDLLRHGRPVWSGLGVEGLQDVPGLEAGFVPEGVDPVSPALIDQYDALIASGIRYPAASFESLKRLAVLARFGVGYDAIDLDAATRAGVLVTTTRGAPDRPVAEGALTFMLALGHQIVNKDRAARAARWEDKHDWLGVELRDRTVGIVGLGAIGRELLRLLSPFGIARALAYDPHLGDTDVPAGVERVPLETLLRESDFVSIHCPLTPETEGLIGDAELALMKPTAFLINTARGRIIEQAALTRALQARTIRGAALDVFSVEPVSPDEPLLKLDNVILSPHGVALTEELYRDYHQSCVASVLAVRAGEVPEHVVNREVIGTPRLEEKLARLRNQ